jgi:serine phosphatase RsbU (regulator of sigma subunit)
MEGHGTGSSAAPGRRWSPPEAAEAILANVDVAVMVRATDGTLVYANQAAADMLELPDPDAVAAESSEQLMGRFDVYDEAGTPVALSDLPGSRVLTGEPDPPAQVVRNVVRASGRERWLRQRATAVRDDRGRVQWAINLIEDVTEAKRNQIAQELLAEAARAVAGSDDTRRTLQAMADAAVPGLADWAGVDLVDARGRITLVAVAHRDPAKVRLGWRLRAEWPVDPAAREGVPAVLRAGISQMIPEITDAMLVAGAHDDEHLALLRSVGLNSIMIVPIRAQDRILGAFSFVSSTSRRFDDRDLRLAEDLGRQAGVLLANAQLNAERARIAHVLQAGLLPGRLPDVPGWDVDIAFRAAGAVNEVGGDFYDIVPFDGGWAVLIGDVVGKGAEAAVLTALARHTLAAIIESTGDPVHALSVLNRRLHEREGGFANLCTIAVLTIVGRQAHVVAAGHPAPLLVRGSAIMPIGRPGLLLGVIDELAVTASSVDLQPGDQLLLYTDGVTDAVGVGDRFGQQRLLAAVTALSQEPDATRGLASRLMGAVDAFSIGDQADDIAIVSLRARAASTQPLAA